MTDLIEGIATLRDGVVAILRVHAATTPEEAKATGQKGGVRVALSFGSGFCVVRDRYVLTAHHVLHGGLPRDPGDAFYVFMVPGNGDHAHHFPVVGYPLERSDLDVAVLEIGSCATPGVHLPALPLSFAEVPDGTRVVTLGFPSPEIGGISVGPDLSYKGGQFFLKSHANEGIVAAQYRLGERRMFELNVTWHHGESGGPIAMVSPEPAVFSLMQHYRNVQSPHGVVAGPHRGLALAVLEPEIRALGAAG